MIPITVAQAKTIVAMQHATHEYNRGVLAMLGKEQLALNYASSHRQIDHLAQQRDAAQGDSGIFAQLNAEAQKYEDQLREATTHCNADWAEIQAIIDKAQQLIDAADDGMDGI